MFSQASEGLSHATVGGRGLTRSKLAIGSAGRMRIAHEDVELEVDVVECGVVDVDASGTAHSAGVLAVLV